MLVGADEGYYGECNFQIELSTPQYVKLDRNLLKGLFGKFNPSRGDLVFSRTGELLGIMVNNTYCLTVRDFNAAATICLRPGFARPAHGRDARRSFTVTSSNCRCGSSDRDQYGRCGGQTLRLKLAGKLWMKICSLFFLFNLAAQFFEN